eukprot:EG_transcript_14202
MYSFEYWEMVQIMVKTSPFHLGPHIDIAIFAHHSWSQFSQSVNASHFILLDEKAFFDMQHARTGAPRPSVGSQASGNKLRIFQLMPTTQNYDVVVMLDADVMVHANFLLLIGRICQETLYTVSHQVGPQQIRTWNYFQSRNITAEEIAYIRAHNPTVFNAGQFVFRPSPLMERLFWEAYKSYKLDPLASLYEQGHMNVVFLLGCQVKYTLTHLVVLGLDYANAEPTPAEYALIHMCQWFEPAAKKVAAMKRHLNTAFRPQSVTRLGILHRLLDRLDSLNSNVTRKLRTSRYAGIEHSRSLIAAYSDFVSHRNVSHMCDVGYHGGHSAAVALFTNPAASLTVFNTAGFPIMAPAGHAFVAGISPFVVPALAPEDPDLV